MNRSKAMLALALLGALIITLGAAQANAAVPARASYQGFLEDGGQPVSGARNLYFVLFGTPTYQDSIWSESHPNVTVDRGVFNVELGSIRPLTAQIVDRAALYLETRVNGVVLSPRKRLDSVPYALVSARADSAGWAATAAQAAHAVTAETAAFAEHAAAADSAAFAEHAAYADSAGSGGGGGTDPNWGASGSNIFNLNAGNVGIGTSVPTRKLHVVTNSSNPAVLIENNSRTGLNVTSAGGVAIGGWGLTNGVEVWGGGVNGVGVFGGADNTGTTIGVSGYAASADGRGVYGQAASPTGSPTGVLGEASSATGYGVAGKNLATSGAGVGVYGTSAGATGSGVYGTASSAGNTGSGVLGATSSSAGYGVWGKNLAGSGASVGVYGTCASSSAGSGVYGHSIGTAGSGVYGNSTGGAGFGVYGNSSGTTGSGVYGNCTGATGFGVKGSGIGTGVYGSASGGAGSGVYGSAVAGTGVYGSGLTGGYFTTTGNSASAHAVSAVSTSEDAAAVDIMASGVAATALYAEASDTGTAYGYGGYFVCRSEDGKAVFGDATSSTGAGNNNYGGYFRSSGGSGAGVLGLSDAPADNTPGVLGQHLGTANLGYGVQGYGNYRGVSGVAYGSDTAGYYHYGVSGSVSGGTAGTNYGVYGFASGGATSYAGYFSGNVHVTGTLSKGAGSFKIDHPLDPANKYLQHSFVESPDMMNVYNGIVVLDGSGQGTVALPDYFETLNRDFRYQLTCVGGFAPVYVADKVAGNRFRIAGGTPGLEVSWQVTGVRQDAYANAHRIAVEVDKPPMERGTYLHAVERGMPEAMQTDRALGGPPEPAPAVLETRMPKKDKK
jgi:hypothetical protein